LSFLCQSYAVCSVAESPENGKYNLIHFTAVKVWLLDLCLMQ